MADPEKSPHERPAFLLLGPEEDLEQVPPFPGFCIHRYDREKPRIIGIVSENPAVIEGWVRRVRADNDLALLPLLVFSSIKTPLREIVAVDGVYPPVFTREVLLAILKEWEPLQLKTDSFSTLPAHQSQRETGRLILLRYLLSRGLEKMEPIRDIHSRIGYSHTIAEMIFQSVDFNDCRTDLNTLENEGFLHSEFADTIHLCAGCGYFQLNFREVCPRCRSADLAEEKNIHHFRCGYVGCESEFSEMRCPKCRRRLKHIGVDYDLPSASFNCLSCKEVFAEPLVCGLCINCGQDLPVEKTVKQVVRSYFLTPEGKRYAVDGPRKISGRVKSELGLLDFEVFKEIFSMQTAIAKRAGNNFLLIMVGGGNVRSSGEKKENSQNNKNNQIAGVLRKILRTQDVMTAPPTGGVLALAAETPKEKAVHIIERIRGALAKCSGKYPPVTFFESNGIPLDKALEKLHSPDKTTANIRLIPTQIDKR